MLAGLGLVTNELMKGQETSEQGKKARNILHSRRVMFYRNISSDIAVFSEFVAICLHAVPRSCSITEKLSLFDTRLKVYQACAKLALKELDKYVLYVLGSTFRSTNACSKLTIETLEKGIKYVQS